jgi:hypothetical protein
MGSPINTSRIKAMKIHPFVSGIAALVLLTAVCPAQDGKAEMERLEKLAASKITSQADVDRVTAQMETFLSKHDDPAGLDAALLIAAFRENPNVDFDEDRGFLFVPDKVNPPAAVPAAVAVQIVHGGEGGAVTTEHVNAIRALVAADKRFRLVDNSRELRLVVSINAAIQNGHGVVSTDLTINPPDSHLGILLRGSTVTIADNRPAGKQRMQKAIVQETLVDGQMVEKFQSIQSNVRKGDFTDVATQVVLTQRRFGMKVDLAVFGIGVGISNELAPHGHLEIVRVTKGSPAGRAGMIPGNIIVSIEGKPVKGLTTGELIDLIGRQENTFELEYAMSGESLASPVRIRLTKERVIDPAE